MEEYKIPSLEDAEFKIPSLKDADIFSGDKIPIIYSCFEGNITGLLTKKLPRITLQLAALRRCNPRVT